jgi:hypothetical protein
VHHQGKFTASGGLAQGDDPSAIGGKTTMTQNVLQKRIDAASRTVGNVGSDDFQTDSLYLSPVSIGTPAQILYLDFDTGSSDLWVWSNELPTNIKNQAKAPYNKIFDATKSSTFKTTAGATWKIGYGDGSNASGDVGTDNISLGGLTVTGQSIERAKQMSTSFVSGAGSGLLGLAWGSINTVQPKPVKTPVDNMIDDKTIPQSAQLFTAYLGSWRDSAEADKDQSFYTFGYIDQNVLKASNNAQLSYAPVDNSQGFWQFQSFSYSINGKTIQRSGNTAIADTGTTLALVADDVCKAIYAAIPGAKYDSANQGYIFPIKTTADKLPDVAFAVGSKLFHVQKEDLGFADAGNGMVYGGIQSRGNLTFDILGDTWLKGIYAVSFVLGMNSFVCTDLIM